MLGMNTKLKTKMCRHFEKGHCMLGDQCKFAHGNTDVRNMSDPLPLNSASYNTEGTPQQMRSQPGGMTFNNYKTIKCKYFESGFCKNSQNCTFAHGDTEIRQLSGQINVPGMNFPGQMMGQYDMSNFQNGQMDMYNAKMMMANYGQDQKLTNSFPNQFAQPNQTGFPVNFEGYQQPNNNIRKPNSNGNVNAYNLMNQQQQQFQNPGPNIFYPNETKDVFVPNAFNNFN